ncbi:type II toxin-antitoxin system RelB/DinJ family antitoxin [Aggregatibacter actinomycetemcomitans]|uniref:type II toxin-antitoxin system RelB/DinJ family antitoxin n=1 Tax=Aggregatibacter actinomycetemcomitans TaxID=714 RepID=UPI0002400859|nr:type II toxin-antitoxin system RelB/DinJ family antitoxin [Aggregatibacter actinomycetemcomitans]EHK89876.1 DNA-damage-inducible protein J [Aggregatibacter actinomycetemcomitans RhAA1]KNE76968.1 translation repressor RelB [Aggregatibacter actinomycetemcomitans RhAA1]MBN6070748.1 type II toxin-antitoxin system RelB/DinJ family antitoxin [Aggregatibacter actinomycetemcomitans]
MLDSAVNFRTQADIKEQAFNVIKSYGLTPAQVLNMFLTQIAKTNTIPLSLDYQPNEVTRRAMEDSLSGEVLHASSFEEFQNQMGDLCKS